MNCVDITVWASQSRPSLKSFWQQPWYLMVVTVLTSWFAMQWVHETGHALTGIVTGGTVSRVSLSPISISKTTLAENPHPLAVVWAGPLFGVAAPVIAWLLMRAWKRKSTFLFRFFAGFCCVANGAYLGFGAHDRVGDCGDLLRHGAGMWQLWLFGGVSMLSGLSLWHGQGAYFGIGPGRLPVEKSHSVVITMVLTTLIVAGLLIGD